MDEIMAEQKQQEELQQENEVLDKKQLKAAKKLEKKKRKQKNPDDLDGDEETVGGKILVFFVTIIIILIWLAIFAMLIKLDVGGFGSGASHFPVSLRSRFPDPWLSVRHSGVGHEFRRRRLRIFLILHPGIRSSRCHDHP